MSARRIRQGQDWDGMSAANLSQRGGGDGEEEEDEREGSRHTIADPLALLLGHMQAREAVEEEGREKTRRVGSVIAGCGI